MGEDEIKVLGWFLIFAMLVCCGIMGSAVIINIHLLFYLRKHVRENMAVREKKHNMCQIKAKKTLLVISICLVVCYIPSEIVFNVIGNYILKKDPRHKTMYNYYASWGHAMMILNAGVNSFIYMWRSRKVRNFYKKIFFD